MTAFALQSMAGTDPKRTFESIAIRGYSESMNKETEGSDNVTGPELVLVTIGVVAFLVPLVLLQTHPDVAWLQKYFGGWKVIVFWAVTFSALFSIEMLLRKSRSRRR